MGGKHTFAIIIIIIKEFACRDLPHGSVPFTLWSFDEDIVNGDKTIEYACARMIQYLTGDDYYLSGAH